jgi:hypothetical protein
LSRYETFVIRVWIENSSVVNHGEIRHPLSGSGRRFVRMQDAMAFIDRYIAEASETAREPAIEQEPGR